MHSNEGSILAYILAIMLVFLAWFNMHVLHSVDYLHANNYVKSIHTTLEIERQVIAHIKTCWPLCEGAFDNDPRYSFVTIEQGVEVYFEGEYWFVYAIHE